MNESSSAPAYLLILQRDEQGLSELREWLRDKQVQLRSAVPDSLEAVCAERSPEAVLVAERFQDWDWDRLLPHLHQLTSAPVLAWADEQAADTLLQNGLDEVIAPSMELTEQGERCLNQLRLGRKLQQSQEDYQELMGRYELSLKRNDELELLAKADPMTGLYNRRYMLRKLQEEASRNQRSRHTFSVLICDLDHFGALNEREGRDVGDRVLQEIALTLTNSCRTYDVIARWGADQFLLLLPETDLTWALVVAERCRRNVERYQFKNGERQIDLRVTTGVAEFRQADGVGGCMRRAEQALKEGKQRGRNCIVYCDVTGSGTSFQLYTTSEPREDSENSKPEN